MRSNNNNRIVALNLPTASTALDATLATGSYIAKTYPKTTSYYLVGLVVALLFTGWSVTPEQAAGYDKIIAKVDTDLEYTVAAKTAEAYGAYYHSKGWFTCDDTCTRLKLRYESMNADLVRIRAEGMEIVSDAKESVGVFSEVAVSEARDSFWSYFNKGAAFAKRQSMYDALFTGFRSMGRNESTGEYLMKMVLQIFMNFSLGLCLTFVTFVIGLWTIVNSFRPSLPEAILFFVLASAAGFATVVTIFGGMTAGIVGGGFAVAKLAEANMRLQDGTNGNGGRIQGGQHAHYQ
jgi:hypothetical protein